jgi:hypothetical protein
MANDRRGFAPFRGASRITPFYGTLIAIDRESVSGANSNMSTACLPFASPERSMSSRRRGCVAALGLVATLTATVAGVGSTRAAEYQSSSSGGFYAPIQAGELERYRAQGLTAPGSGDMTIGVILWDEYRRTRQPRDTSDVSGAHGATVSLAATARAR